MKKNMIKNLAKVVVGLIKIAGVVAIYALVDLWVKRDFSVPGEEYLFGMFASMFILFITISYFITKEFLLYGVSYNIGYISLRQNIFVLFVKLMGILFGVASALLYFKYSEINDPYYIVKFTMVSFEIISIITAFARKEDIVM